MIERGYITRAEFLDHIRRDWKSAHSIRAGIYDFVELDYSKIKGLTAKSIPYAGATGYLTEDNAELSWDYSTDTLHIGTISISDGSIIDSGGSISFGNENLVTTGTFGCGTITVADGGSISLQEDITFTGATTENQIKFPDNLADALSFKEEANAYLTFDTRDGIENILFSKPLHIYQASEYPIEVEYDGDCNIQIANWSNNIQDNPTFRHKRGRGTNSSPAIVQENDVTGEWTCYGWDGATWRRTGRIYFIVDGTPGSGDMPGRIDFEVTPDGGFTPALAMRINNAGDINFQDGNVVTTGTLGCGTLTPGNIQLGNNYLYFNGGTTYYLYHTGSDVRCACEGYFEILPNNDTFGLILRDKDGAEYGNLQNVDGITYIGDGTATKGNMIAINGTAVTLPGVLTVVGCVTDGTCEIMKNENAIEIIDYILKTGTGKKDEYNHEHMDMEKIYSEYPFLIYEARDIETGRKKYYDILGAKGDLAYAAILELNEKIVSLEQENILLQNRIEQLEA